MAQLVFTDTKGRLSVGREISQLGAASRRVTGKDVWKIWILVLDVEQVSVQRMWSVLPNALRILWSWWNGLSHWCEIYGTKIKVLFHKCSPAVKQKWTCPCRWTWFYHVSLPSVILFYSLFAFKAIRTWLPRSARQLPKLKDPTRLLLVRAKSGNAVFIWR